MSWDANKKVYTKTGDRLTTSLPRVARVSKADERLNLLGTIDELTSNLGVIRAEYGCSELDRFLVRIQKNLMTIMGGIAANFVPESHFEEHEVELLEKAIDRAESEYPRENRFYLPGESLKGAHIDVARTITRRAERCMAACDKILNFPPEVLQYMNRLSDYLYVLARYTDYKEKHE